MKDNFDMYSWKFKQYLNEGTNIEQILKNYLKQKYPFLDTRIGNYNNDIIEIEFLEKHDIDSNIFNQILNYIKSQGYQIIPTQTYSYYDSDEDNRWYPKITFLLNKSQNKINKEMKLSEYYNKDKIRAEIKTILSEIKAKKPKLDDEKDIIGDEFNYEEDNIDVGIGISQEEKVIQDLLQRALMASNVLGNQKLIDQISNTITFFTREYILNRNNN